jgi:glutamate synthase (ferredoxin)
VIMGSEAGVLPVAPENVAYKGRLEPGRMFLVNMDEGRIVADEEIKQEIATAQPYREWLDQYRVELANLPDAGDTPHTSHPTPLTTRQRAFGYSFEELRILLKPMAQNGVEAIGAMGTDTPLPVLSDKPRLLYDYFHQLFAQVTNPPIDSIREAIITSAETTIGSERNLLKPEPESCHLVNLKTPILTNAELAKLKQSEEFPSITLPILFNPKDRSSGDGSCPGRNFRGGGSGHRRGQEHHHSVRSGCGSDPGGDSGCWRFPACTTT